MTGDPEHPADSRAARGFALLKHLTPRASVRDELAAMDAVWSCIEGLDLGACRRVLSWARDQVTSEALAELAQDSPNLNAAQREQLAVMAEETRR